MRLLLPLVLLAALLSACGSKTAAPSTPTPTTNVVARVATVPQTTPPPIKGRKHSHTGGHSTLKALPTTRPILPATPTPIPAKSYTATIVGTVRDARTRSPLAGALVAAVGGARSTHTDAFGRYSLTFPGGVMATVQVKMNGYAGELSIGKIPAHKKLRLDFKLIRSTPSHPAAPPAPSLFGTPSIPTPLVPTPKGT
jgi:hypothetical protein